MAQPLIQAVIRRDAEAVRALLDAGANPLEGVYPHRDATAPLTIAEERGYTELATLMREAVDRYRDRVRASAAEPAARAQAADEAAVVNGDLDWLRSRYAAGGFTNRITDEGGLLTVAVRNNQPEALSLLLDFGFDPNERTPCSFAGPKGDVFTQGMPLWHCAGSGQYEVAAMLLRHGADPNASVYASGDPVFQAYSARNWKMVELLGQYGGVPTAATAGLYRQTELGRRMLSGHAPYRLEGSRTLPEELLWGAACGGDPELVRLALERIDWGRNDPRWFGMLEQPIRVWDHGGKNGDRSTYPECLRLLLERCDPNLRGREEDGFGLTLLHSVAGSREHVTAEERLAFATLLLDAGARLDIRDRILESTPPEWASRWGRTELVSLFLQRS